MDYAVGPIPNPTTYEPYQLPGWTGPIPYNAFSIEAPSYFSKLVEVLIEELPKMNDVLAEISNGYTYGPGCNDNCLEFTPAYAQQPVGTTGVPRTVIVSLYRFLEGYEHHPIGVDATVLMDFVNGFSLQKV